MPKQEITLASTLDGKPYNEVVFASIKGVWAIHGTPGHWTCTHVPTGYALANGSLATLRRVRDRLIAEVPGWDNPTFTLRMPVEQYRKMPDFHERAKATVAILADEGIYPHNLAVRLAVYEAQQAGV